MAPFANLKIIFFNAIFVYFRSVRSSSVQVKAVEVAHSLAITSSGIPLIPDADRGFSPDPGSHVEEIALLATSEHSSVSHQSGAAEEQPTSNVSLQKELDTIQKPHGNCMYQSVF